MNFLFKNRVWPFIITLKGVGQGKILGRIHAAELTLGGLLLQFFGDI